MKNPSQITDSKEMINAERKQNSISAFFYARPGVAWVSGNREIVSQAGYFFKQEIK